MPAVRRRATKEWYHTAFHSTSDEQLLDAYSVAVTSAVALASM
jgi:hypothetical protein